MVPEISIYLLCLISKFYLKMTVYLIELNTYITSLNVANAQSNLISFLMEIFTFSTLKTSMSGYVYINGILYFENRVFRKGWHSFINNAIENTTMMTPFPVGTCSRSDVTRSRKTDTGYRFSPL